MYGIQINKECNIVHGILNEFSNKIGFNGEFSFDEAVSDSLKDCRKEIDERFDQKKLYSLDAKMSKFLGNLSPKATENIPRRNLRFMEWSFIVQAL